MTCSGDSSQLCGGTWAIEIYQSSSSTATTTSSTTTTTAVAPTWSPLGCFTDAGSRALNGASTSSSSNTPASCISYCNSRGFTLAGMEYGQECYCSSTIAYSGGAGQPADSSACSTPCSGNSALTVSVISCGHSLSRIFREKGRLTQTVGHVLIVMTSFPSQCGGAWALNIYASPAFLNSAQSVWKIKDTFVSKQRTFDCWMTRS